MVHVSPVPGLVKLSDALYTPFVLFTIRSVRRSCRDSIREIIRKTGRASGLLPCLGDSGAALRDAVEASERVRAPELLEHFGLYSLVMWWA